MPHRLSHVKLNRLRSSVGLDAALRRQSKLVRPTGSLGRLEHVALDLAFLQDSEFPVARPAAAVLFAADHPVVRHGVTSEPMAATATALRRLQAGGAAASVACEWVHGIPLALHDVGVDTPYALTHVKGAVPVVRHRLAQWEPGDIRVEDAMSPGMFAAGLEIGSEAVFALEPRPRVLVLGELGTGNFTPACAVAAALLGQPVEQLTAPRAGVDPVIAQRNTLVVTDAIARLGADDPMEVLRRVGGRELVALVGAARAAREIGAAVIVDGFAATAALYAAVLAEPELREHLIFSHLSSDPGHALLLRAMDAKPLLDLDIWHGQGTGALAAYGLVEFATRLHCDMALATEALATEPPLA